MADKKMEAQISVEFEEATSRQSLNSGERINILWSKVKRWLSDLKAVAFSGSYSDLSDTPTTATTTHDGLMSASDKGKLDGADDTYALKSKYGDTTINVGRRVNAPIGDYSTSLGIGTVANGYASTAEGAGSQAAGYASHAGGCSCQAIKEGSFAHGYEVYANHDYETAFGKHNVSNDDTLFSIGDGIEINTDGNISIARHNAFEITTTGGKLHDKDIATTNDIPNLSAYAKTADVPNIKVNSAVDADTVGGHSVGCDVPENAVFTDTVVDINTMVYTAVYNDVTWVESGLGKFYFSIDLPNINKILSINLENWELLAADEIIQPCIYSNQQILIMSNVAKSNGKMAFQITYI